MNENGVEQQNVVKEPDLGVNLCGVHLANPVMTASGTFGSGMEYSDFVDLNRLGAVVTKGVSLVPWEGNPSPRVAETYGGMLNAIGLENPGIDVVIKRDLPFLSQFTTKVIVNVCGHTQDEYVAVAERLSCEEEVDMLEINVSCPNVQKGGMAMGTDLKTLSGLTSKIKKVAKKPIIIKLTPNVTSIADMAKAAEDGGADAVSLINTITGMKIDVERQTFVLANKTGGLSGPAIHPVAVRMVYEVRQAVSIPIIGMGGIQNADDAVELMLAGASAVAVGMSNFHDPDVTMKIVDGIHAYAVRHHLHSISEIVGAVH